MNQRSTGFKEVLEVNRDAILAASHRCNTKNPRVFGDAVRDYGVCCPEIDILVDVTDKTTMEDIAALRSGVRGLLGDRANVHVSLTLPQERLQHVLSEARPL